MTKAQVREYMYENNVRGDLSIESMAEDIGTSQGEWKDRTYGGRILHPWWESCECSQCEEWGSGAWNFCPHCGARMKGADDDL